MDPMDTSARPPAPQRQDDPSRTPDGAPTLLPYHPAQYNTPLPSGDDSLLKNPSIAFVIELVGGMAGFLGLGHLYAGRFLHAFLLLVGWWVVIFVSLTPLSILSGTLGGFAIFLVALLYLVPVASALWLRNALLQQRGTARP